MGTRRMCVTTHQCNLDVVDIDNVTLIPHHAMYYSYMSQSSATPTERIYMWGENYNDFLITLPKPLN